MLELKLNHSNAMEATEETVSETESGLRLSGLSTQSFAEDQTNEVRFAQENTTNLMSPTIPIPSSSKRSQLNTIDCEIGSKISMEDIDSLDASMSQKTTCREKLNTAANISETNADNSSIKRHFNWSDHQTQYQISDMCTESIVWLSHRLGPVLTARHLTRNLLKMLTLCYIGQETLLPDFSNDVHDNLLSFTIADARITGDRNAVKVLGSPHS